MIENNENDEEWCIFVRKQTEMGKSIKDIDVTKLVVNPFAETLRVEVSKIEDPTKMIPDENGEMVPAHYYVEKDKANKIYLSAANRNAVMKLSTGAMRMYMFILHDISLAHDWITVLPDWYKAHGGKSLNVYKQAIEELIMAGYISNTMYKYTYWINPRIFYPGSRINKYPSNIVHMNSTGSKRAGVKMNNSKRENQEKADMESGVLGNKKETV